MSVIGVHPPQFLNLSSENLAEAFRDFRQSWEIFVLASEIGAKPDNIKVALLKNFMGLDAVKVLDTLLPVADQANPEVILNALGGYCLPQTNETYERFVFNTAVQRESEEVIEFVSRLRKLAVSCNFGNLKDSMIRDRIVVGIRSDDTRKALLKTVNLTLAGAIDICRAQKLVDDRLTAMKVKQEIRESEDGLETIAKCKEEKSRYRERVKCKYCGRDDHKIGNREDCPANGVTCRNCGKQNHYARVCRTKPEKKEEPKSEESRNLKKKHTKKVDNIEESDSDLSDYVANVEEVNVVDKKITTEINFSVGKSDEARKIRCQVDTGASCNVITLHALKYITGGQLELEHSDTKLKGFGGQMVPAVGKSVLRHRGELKRFRVAFQVVDLPPKILPMPLLGYKTCIALGIVSINSVKVCDEEGKRESVNNQEAVEVVERFSDVFEGDGKLKGKVNIELNDELPRVQEPRRVPVQVREKLISELENLEKRGLIEKVNEPTEWTSNIVIVMRNEKIRICLDPTDLNRAIRRPRYQMATLEEILPDLKDAKVFSTLDVRNGFWHVELTDRSSRLTAFWTPEGRYVWKRLPFGLSCAPEIFQLKFQEALHGLEGIEVLVDDILCVGRGKTQQEAMENHNKNLAALLQRCREMGIKLNRNKMKLNQTEVRFFGHVLSKEGLKPDPLKTSAIQEMPEPKNVAELHRFMGLATYMAKFIPRLSEVSVPLRNLLKGDRWAWGNPEQAAFNKLKEKITNISSLKYFDPDLQTTIQCDASGYALGAVLLQEGRPIMFASRMLSVTEQRYAQIEKETLAILFACKRFDQYIFGGKKVIVESDHQPLQTIFKKPLASAPNRIKQMMLSLQRYSLEIRYVKGSKLVLADTLSRNIDVKKVMENDEWSKLWFGIEKVNALDEVDMQEAVLDQIRRETQKDEVLLILKTYIMNGWPDNKTTIPDCIKPYHGFRQELVIQDGIILRNDRVVVPTASRKKVSELLHYNHQGEQAILRKARGIVFWPNMNDHLRNFVKTCEICNQFKGYQQSEPMQTCQTATFPFEIVSLDIGEVSCGDKKLLIVTVDHFSNFFEVNILNSQATKNLVECAMQIFSRFGIPRKAITDSAKQFVSVEWQTFMRNYGIAHSTSAPYHHASNGKAESAIKIAKNIIKKALHDGRDYWLAILEWRNTPQADGYSPAQKVMGHNIRGLWPIPFDQLRVQGVDWTKISDQIKMRKIRSKFYHDRKSQPLPTLERGQDVYVQLRPEATHQWTKGRVAEVLSDRDYSIEVNGSNYRRNRVHIRDSAGMALPEREEEDTDDRYLSFEDPLAVTSTPNTNHSIKAEPLAVSGNTSRSSCTNQTSLGTYSTSTSKTMLTGDRPQRQVRRPLKFNDFILN